MASVEKRGQVYHAMFRVPDGVTEHGKTKWKLVRRSTGKKNYGEAVAHAHKLEQQHRAQVMASDGRGERLHAILTKATENALKGTLTEVLARKLMQEIYREATGSELDSYTVREWFEEWIQRKDGRVKPSTFSRYKRSGTYFIEWLGSRADQRLEMLTKKDIRQFHDFVACKRTNATANGYKKDVNSSLQEAVKEGVLSHNPAAGAQNLPEEDSTEREPFTLEEVKKICMVATQEWRVCILLGLYGGLRLTDATNLRWSNINLEEATLRFEPRKQKRVSKTKKVIQVKLHPALATEMGALSRGLSPDDYILPSLANRKTSGKSGLSQNFNDLMDRAGIDPKVTRCQEMGAARRVAKLSYHSLRHTCNSLLANAGVDQERRMKIIGHTDDATNDIYTHWSSDELARVIDLLPSLPE